MSTRLAIKPIPYRFIRLTFDRETAPAPEDHKVSAQLVLQCIAKAGYLHFLSGAAWPRTVDTPATAVATGKGDGSHQEVSQESYQYLPVRAVDRTRALASRPQRRQVRHSRGIDVSS